MIQNQTNINNDFKIKDSNWIFFVYNILIANEKIVQFILLLLLIALWQISSFYKWVFTNLIQNILIVVFIIHSLKSLNLKSELTNLIKIIILATVFTICSIFLIIDDRDGFMPWNVIFWLLLSQFYTIHFNFFKLFKTMLLKIKNINKYRKIY